MGRDQTDEMSEDGQGEEAQIDALHSLWVPQADVEKSNVQTEMSGMPLGDIHIHRFCDILPRRRDLAALRDYLAGLRSGRERTKDAESDVGTDADAGTDAEFTFVDGMIRTGLRFTPLIILLVTLGMVVYGELSPTVQGISALVPAIPWIIVALVAAGGVLWLVILALLDRIDLINAGDFLKAVFVFGLLFALAAGTVYSIYLVVTADDPSKLPSNVVFLSGYLLMLLLGGLFVYDGMLRTEFLIENFGRWNHGIATSEKIYNQWKSDLIDDLNDDVLGDLTGGAVSFKTSHLLAALFVFQFGVVWYFGRGPQSLGSPVNFWLNVVLDFFLVVIAFRFLILVRAVHELMADSYAPEDGVDDDDYDGKVIKYEPFHVDRHGGFQEFGKFATRVNVLLTLGGLYTVYRLTVQGFRVMGTGGLSAFESNVGQIVWFLSYVGPVIAYALAAVAWLYYSFWAMHRKMVLEKQALFIDQQGSRGETEELPQTGDPIDEFDTGPDWYYLSVAPEWPINSKWLASLVSVNFAPLLFPLLKIV